MVVLNYKFIASVSYMVSIVCISFGFYKMFVYENPESYVIESKNTYVGGDAYNYIINANYTTSYFILALLFVVIGSTFFIASFLNPTLNDSKEAESTTEESYREDMA